jgi:Tol biopolymer transport system component/imidazolonepropionase-like amidohydrolase
MITVTDGTNYSVAADPTGRTLAIDLLGSLWAVPGQGGTARKITEELIEAKYPSFSPDGSTIVFQGFKDSGGWDLWSIKPDGSDAKRLTSGPFDDMEPAWSHDGTRIAFSSDRNRNFDVWIFDVKSGAVRSVTKNAAQDFEPAWSPDDKEIAFVRQEAAPPGARAASSTTVMAMNVQTGAERQLAKVEGRVGPPTWTPDGKQVIYDVITGGASRLEMGGKTVVAGEDVFPARVQWLSANEFLYTSDGKIKKRTLGSDKAQTVEFTANIAAKPGKYVQRKFDFDSRAPRKALGIVRPVVSPDGKQVAFAAVGDLWLMEIGSKPKRVTHDRFIDTDPSWSPDGAQLAYSTDRGEMGNLDVWVRNVKTGAERRITKTPYADFGANWSPDGKHLAFLSMLPHQQGAAVCVTDLQTGKTVELWRSVQRIPSYPTWSPDGNTLLVSAFDQYSPRFREGIWKPLLIPVAGGQAQWADVTPDFSLTNGVDEGPVWSPDGTKLALAHEGLLKVMTVENGKPTGQFKQLTSEPIQSPSWTKDSKKILCLATDQLKMVSVDDGQATNVPLDLTYQSDIPQGRYVIHAGHVWNGVDTSLKNDVDIVVEGNRIKSIEPHSVALHTGAKVIDASNRTVIPGLVEMHGHIYREYGEAAGRLLLSYGVTSVRDPAGMGYRCLELKEASEAGARMGPRFYFSAPPLDGARGAFAEMYCIYSMERLERELERDKRLGYDLLKMYVKLPLAFQKRVVEFGLENGIPMTSHFIYPDSTWGAAGTEHTGGRTSALGNVYSDMVQLFLKAGIQWCPTLAVSGGYDLVAADDPTYIDDVRLKTLCPEWALAPSRLRLERAKQSGSGTRAQSLARTGKALVTLTRAGIPLLTGTDSPNMPNGVGLQAELELLVRSGLTPIDVLKAATVNAAEALGNRADLGSIEPGKVADMVIVDGDPLADIRNARKVITVIKNGNVFDMKALLGGAAASRVKTTAPTPRSN